MGTRILFITPYPFDTAPGQRFRYEQYFDILKENGFEFFNQSFLENDTWLILYKKGFFIQKIRGIIKGFLKRIHLLFFVSKYDFVFIFREATPIGPPIFEWIIAKVFRKRIIYDFDDAIWLPNTSEHNKVASKIKWHSKVKSICKWAYKVSAGNQYLADFAKKYSQNVIVNPTTIDMETWHNKTKNQQETPVVIGWTGTHSTMSYLNEVLPVLKALEEKVSFEFCVISNINPVFELKSLRFVPWKKETEVQDLLRFNIGIMPLTEDPWSKGKCGFKALQYMSLGIPALVSPVGVNKVIVDNDINGFICSNYSEWLEGLEVLISNISKRETMGKAAKEKVKFNYSVKANTKNFLSLFE